jgi:hypothetical protein
MLKNPSSFKNSSILDALAEAISGQPNFSPNILEEGFAVIPHFSGDILIWGRNSPEMYMGYPEFHHPDASKYDDYLYAYGVVDTPQQFIERFKDTLQKDERTFFVTFTHIEKDRSNRGQGGGWRWHKWGPYIGNYGHECEYLDDEDGFENGVYTYHIYQIDGPNLNRSF